MDKGGERERELIMSIRLSERVVVVVLDDVYDPTYLLCLARDTSHSLNLHLSQSASLPLVFGLINKMLQRYLVYVCIYQPPAVMSEINITVAR